MKWTRPAALALVPVLAVACGDDSAGGADGESTGNSSITTAGMTFTTTSTGDGTMGDTTGSVDESTSSTTGTVMPECPTVSCGPGECCDDDEECVIGACLPQCDSGVRCGADLSVCCMAGQVCLQPECVTPGAPCLDSYDCPEGEFCEPTLGQCLPNQDPVQCEIDPMFTEIELVLEWSAETDESVVMPLVGDIDGDDLPEVVMNTVYYQDVVYQGELVVLDGQNGNEKLRITEGQGSERGSYSRSTPALGDVDGNGLADIVYAGYPLPGAAAILNRSHIYAVDATGQQLFVSHNADMSIHPVYIRQGAITLANFDQDAESEVVIGIYMLDNDGLVVHDQDNALALGGGVFGSNADYLGGISAVADMTDDGIPEVVSGREAWSIEWIDPAFGPPTVNVTELWSTGGNDGYPAIADFDGNGSPEVALVASSQLIILDGQTGQLWCGRDPTGLACAGNMAARTQPYTLPDDGMGGAIGRGGPATIADFDGDGLVEVGVAGATAYTVFDFNRPNEEVVQPMGFAPPGPGDIFVLWTQPTQDQTSNATGSAVFDFQGDGIAEVMYQDECYARVYDGRTGDVLVELENSSSTIHEYPVVADVDGDNNSEFIVVANDHEALMGSMVCAAIPGYTPRRGVFVYGDSNDQWVPTRDIWTQHTYHVTNATSAALTPPVEANNWEQLELNNYRQNVQGEGVFNAPDLSVEVAVGFSGCLDEEFQIVVTVRNTGSLGVAAGVNVTLYEGLDETGILIGTQQTPDPLLPGGFVQLVWFVDAPADVAKNFYAAVDDADLGTTGMINECDETNNTAITETVACPTPG